MVKKKNVHISECYIETGITAVRASVISGLFFFKVDLALKNARFILHLLNEANWRHSDLTLTDISMLRL